MKSRHLFYVLVVGVVLLLAGIPAVGVGSNYVLAEKSDELTKLKADSRATEALQTQLNRNKADLVKYKDLNEIAKAIVPQDKDQTQTVREIVSIAERSGVPRLTSVTFPSSTLGVGKKDQLTQVLPVKDMAGVYALPITISVNEENAVPYSQLITFLDGLEQNRRTAQVTSLALTPSQKDINRIAFTIVINEYIKP